MMTLITEADDSYNFTTATLIQDPPERFDFHNLYIGICSFGIPGNILTVGVLLSSASLREKPINLFMVHQSIIDSTMLLLTILNKLYNDITLFPEGKTIF